MKAQRYDRFYVMVVALMSIMSAAVVVIIFKNILSWSMIKPVTLAPAITKTIYWLALHEWQVAGAVILIIAVSLVVNRLKKR